MVAAMTDYDAIVIGAGHNGLTAAAVMARGGLRVLCLEKNHYVGGMASTTELVKGYKFEIAGSVLFPMPDEIYDDLGLERLSHLRGRGHVGQRRAAPTRRPMLFYSDPEQLMEHIAETNGMDAVLGMAEIMAWCEAPARAIGRFDVRKPPKSLDEMFACATNEAEREAIKVAMFGSVMDVVDRFLPDRERHSMLRGMLAFLAVNSTYRGPYTPGQRHVPRLRHGHDRLPHDAQAGRRHRRPVRARPGPPGEARRRPSACRPRSTRSPPRRARSPACASPTARSSPPRPSCPTST